jgi:hypothetical protein
MVTLQRVVTDSAGSLKSGATYHEKDNAVKAFADFNPRENLFEKDATCSNRVRELLRIRYNPTTQHNIVLIEHGRLTRADGALRSVKLDMKSAAGVG